MSRPLYWPSPPRNFHPLGCSPAISLTQDLTPEQSANILMLHCNDVYNILFTLDTDVFVGPGLRKMDITCNDIEPAILARNILVFTLLHDQAPIEQIWNLYYDFNIDEPASNLLTVQSRRLADASQTMENWAQCTYYAFIKIVDTHTLGELHNLWTRYAQFPALSADQLAKFRSQQTELSDAILDKLGSDCIVSASRSATVLWNQATVPVSDEFKRFWRTGTAPISTKNDALNPTWVYSSCGEEFKPHPRTFPLSFHFVSAFMPGKRNPNQTHVPSSALDKAKAQFKAGCEAFRAFLRAESIIIRFHSGEPIQFAWALRSWGTNSEPIFALPWSARTIDLSPHFWSSPPPPSTFDVIDTAQFASSCGIINILLATKPLLSAPRGIIYTETHTMAEDGALQLFAERIACDVPTFSLFMGLAPLAYLSGFGSQFSTPELATISSSEYFQRITWASLVPSLGADVVQPPVRFSVAEMADCLFSMYRRIHCYDNPPASYASASLPLLRTWSELSSTRETVAMVFKQVQTQAMIKLQDGTWEEVAQEFLALVSEDTITYCGDRHLEDLKLHLGTRGITTLPECTGTPPVVCVVLRIPARAPELGVLMSYSEAVPPPLACRIQSLASDKSQMYSSLHAVWGKLVQSGETCVIQEDPIGPKGDSDLIISFWVTPGMLKGDEATLALVFRYTPLNYRLFHDTLGEDLVIFNTRLSDSAYVLVLHERPTGLPRAQRPILLPSLPNEPAEYGADVKSTWKNSRWYLKNFTIRIDATEEEKSVLQSGVKLSTEQIGPCTVCIKLGELARPVVFPYPIREKNTKLRIARASGYIEVTADPFSPLDGGYPHTLFPVLLNPLTPWNVHHLPLDKMPPIDVSNTRQMIEWLVPHLALQHSDHERIVMFTKPVVPRDKLHALKLGISALMHDYFGPEPRGGPFEAFVLQPPDAGVQILLLVGGMRIDVAGGTVVLDTAVVPVSSSNKATVLPLLDPIGEGGVLIMSLEVKHGEMGIWKEYLAACVERTRTWSHKPECEYIAAGHIPLSLADNEESLCGCGRGIGFSGSEWFPPEAPQWAQLLPHATRAAISPIFSVPYLEIVGGPEFQFGGYGCPPPSTVPLNGCWGCAKSGVPLSACARCKRARYCSVECQQVHWVDHKKLCRK